MELLTHQPYLLARLRTEGNIFWSISNSLRKFVGLPVFHTVVKIQPGEVRMSLQTR